METYTEELNKGYFLADKGREGRGNLDTVE